MVHGRPSGGRVSAGPIRTVSGGRLGLQLLVEFVKLAAHRCLVLQVLTVQPLDELVSWLLALVVGVMAIAEQELAACRGMLPDPPAARLVTVVLPDQLVDGRADRAEDAELLQVRAEPGPEPVVRAWLIEGARVHPEPVIELPRVENPEDDHRRSGAAQADHSDQAPLHRWSLPWRPGLTSGRRLRP